MNSNTHAKIRFLCRRGMSEIETVLTDFFEQHFAELSPQLQQQFAELLAQEDMMLWDCLIIKSSQPPANLQTIVSLINQHATT